MPPNTAPAGFECPGCSKPIIPIGNAAGPVVDALKEHLKNAAWARPGLGLPTEAPNTATAATAARDDSFDGAGPGDAQRPGNSFFAAASPVNPAARPSYHHSTLEMNGASESSERSCYFSSSAAVDSRCGAVLLKCKGFVS